MVALGGTVLRTHLQLSLHQADVLVLLGQAVQQHAHGLHAAHVPTVQGGLLWGILGAEGVGCSPGGAEDAAAPLQPRSLRCRCRAQLPAPRLLHRGSSHPQDLGRNHTLTSSTRRPALLTALPAHRLPCRRNHLERRERDSNGDLHLHTPP